MKCNRTLHDEFRHGSASAPEHAGSVFLRFCCSVPPSSRHHAFCFVWRGFLFFDLVWWWRARSGFSKGETDGILVPIRWTRFCQNYFLGIWIWQNRDCISRPQKGVWGMNAGGFCISDLAGMKFFLKRETILLTIWVPFSTSIR